MLTPDLAQSEITESPQILLFHAVQIQEETAQLELAFASQGLRRHSQALQALGLSHCSALSQKDLMEVEESLNSALLTHNKRKAWESKLGIGQNSALRQT